MVEFSDLQCPHCKDAQPTLDRLAAEDKNARVVFQNFPLPMHDWAMKAAAYADCVGRSSRMASGNLFRACYGAQSDITAANADEKLTGFADAAGVKGSDVATCAAKTRNQHPHTALHGVGQVARRQQHSHHLHQWPKLSAGGLPYEVLQKLVDFAASKGN